MPMFPGDFNLFGGSAGASNPSGVAAQNYMGNDIGQMPSYSQVGSMAGVQMGATGPQVGPGGGGGGGGNNSGLGFNIGTGQLVLGGITAIGNLWAAWEAQKLAKEQFKFGKDMANTNLANSIQSYNTSLTDRINTRAFTEGRPEGYAEQYVQDNKMVDTRERK